MDDRYRWESDSIGRVKVPEDALYGAQTQRAVNNFPVSGWKFTRELIRALGQVKLVAARVNAELGLLTSEMARAIERASLRIIAGEFDDQFPVDIFQTGSGTSSNMNANEVIANLVRLDDPHLNIHPNDHVNLGQSSNDVIPSVIRIAAYEFCHRDLLPVLKNLQVTFLQRVDEFKGIIKTGRTHLMDAMPVTFGQELSGYARQIELGITRIDDSLKRLAELPMGGTAVGTGINTHPEFPSRFAKAMAELTGCPFREAENHFEAQSTVDAAVDLSGQLKTLSVSLIKIANDFRWMNSGPIAGLSEIRLPPLQPGSSIMPAKVNPVMEESLSMVCTQVIGFDHAITIAGLSGNFELNVMLPLVAFNLLESIRLLANSVRLWTLKSVSQFTVSAEKTRGLADQNPVLVTALNRLIGYDEAAKIAKVAMVEKRSILEVAAEYSGIPKEELMRILDPKRLTEPGLPDSK